MSLTQRVIMLTIRRIDLKLSSNQLKEHEAESLHPELLFGDDVWAFPGI